MNILFLTTHLNTGGITSYLLTLSREFLARGHRVWIVSAGGNMAETFAELGARLRPLGFRTKSALDPRLYLALPALRRLMIDEKIDVAHAQTRVTQVMARSLSRQRGVPCVSTCHGFFRPSLLRRMFPFWGDAVIAISPAVARHLEKDFHVPAGNIILIPNGIKVDDFYTLSVEERRVRRQALGLGDGPLAGIIARLSDVKGHSVLIDAMPQVIARVPQAQLMIVGEGRMEGQLKERVDRLGLNGRIHFYPVVNRTPEILPLLDIFVMPSLQEGLGLSVMEAQAAALPVVASRVGGLPSLIEHGRTGFLVPPADSPALAEAMVDLFLRPEAARQMGREAQAFIREKFSSGTMAEKTLDCYQKMGVVRKD